jgi:hypothetical protein
MRVGRVEEEPEGVLDVPHDARLGDGGRQLRQRGGQHDGKREAQASAKIDPHRLIPQAAARPVGVPAPAVSAPHTRPRQ